MNIHELALLCAHVIKGRTDVDVALLVRIDTGQPDGWAVEGCGGSAFADTACVRLLQSKAQAGFAPSDYYVYSTRRPTVMCIGMGVRCHATHYIFVTGAGLGSLTPASINLQSDRVVAPLLTTPALPWAGAFAEVEASITGAKKSILAAIRDDDQEVLRLFYNELTRRVPDGARWLLVAMQQRLAPTPAPRFARATTQRHCGAPASPLRDRMYILLTWALLDLARRRGGVRIAGKNVACILVGPDGQVLSWAVNTNADNTTRHAETNCLQSFLRSVGRAIPRGCTMYTTLESCEMCAAMLVTVADDITVVFATADPGIGNTALRATLNGSSQRRYVGHTANPIARANLRRLVGKVMTRQHEAHGREFGEHVVESVYDPGHPRPNPTVLRNAGRDVRVEMQAHAVARKAYEVRVKDLYTRSRVGPLEQMVRTLPDSVTNALDRPEVASAFGVYSNAFFQLARDVLQARRYASMDLSRMTPADVTIPAFQQRSAFLAQHPDLKAVTQADVTAFFNCLLVFGVADGGDLLVD